MDLIIIIKKIIFLPIEFGKNGNNESIYSLLQLIGYFDVYDKITENAILQELINHLDCIEHWLAWSENKRSTDGWFFLKKGSGVYVVGNIGLNGQVSEKLKFVDATEACAVFIKKEIESIRIS